MTPARMLSDFRIALEESVKLQSHYAALLNDYDGGARLRFDSAEAWVDRLRRVGTLLHSDPLSSFGAAAIIASVPGGRDYDQRLRKKIDDALREQWAVGYAQAIADAQSGRTAE